MSDTPWRYPCYCLPGPARCDDDTACDRAAVAEHAAARVPLAEHAAALGPVLDNLEDFLR